MAHRAEPLIRKTVTVLFCDVVGSTSLGERVDPETTRRVILRYFDETRTVLERHGGTVEKFIGDAVMAVFGVPVLHEDDALRAVRAADELRTCLERLNHELRERWGVRLEWRIGVNTGEVVVGDPGSTQTIGSGDTFNVAARLQQAAQPGEILLGPETYRLVSKRVRAGPLEAFSLKGKQQFVSTWRLDEVRAGAEQIFRRLDSPLVGREAEREHLHGLYRDALDEQSCRLVTVVGPAGIGKTRLAQEVAARLFGATLTHGRCLPYGDGITFHPVSEIVRSLADVAADDGHDRLRERVGALLSTEEESAFVADRIVALVGGDGSVRAEEAFWAVRKLLEAVARPRPLVIVLEDVHWAEPKLLDLIEYLVGWTRGAPILIVVLARPELVEARPSWPGERLTLEPLAAEEVRALLANVLGSAELDHEIARRIEAAADGNPLFVEELCRMLIDDGTIVLEDGRWVTRDVREFPIPPSIGALLAARLDRLDPEEQTVLQCAAVIGKQFWWSAVAELAPAEMRERVGAHLHALVRKRLVFPAESTIFVNEDSFRFGHILMRDAAYAALPKASRAEMHEQYADWLTRRTGERRGEYEEIVGHHLEQAHSAWLDLGPANDMTAVLGERAGRHLASAGRRALLREDTHAARTLLRRAAALLPQDGAERLELLPDLGSVLMRAGEFAAAGDVFDELAKRAAATGDRRLELRAAIERQFQRYFTAQASTDEMRLVTEAVIPELEELGDDVGLARAWWLASEVHTSACRWGERAAALERALEHAGRARDDQQQTTLIGLLVLSLVWGPTPVQDAIARCVEFHAHAVGNRALEAALTSALAALHAMNDDVDEARALWAQARTIYDELGLSYRRAARSLVPAIVEMLGGNPGAAERELRWGYDTLSAMGERGARSTLAAFLAEALYAQNRLEEAEQFSEICESTAAADDVVTQVMWRAARAKIHARRGRFDDAERLATESHRLAEETDFPDLRAGALMALAEVMLLAGRVEEAEPLVQGAQEIHERKGNVLAARAAGSLFTVYAR